MSAQSADRAKPGRNPRCIGCSYDEDGVCVADDFYHFHNVKAVFCENWKQLAERFKLVTP